MLELNQIKSKLQADQTKTKINLVNLCPTTLQTQYKAWVLVLTMAILYLPGYKATV